MKPRHLRWASDVLLAVALVLVLAGVLPVQILTLGMPVWALVIGLAGALVAGIVLGPRRSNA